MPDKPKELDTKDAEKSKDKTKDQQKSSDKTLAPKKETKESEKKQVEQNEPKENKPSDSESPDQDTLQMSKISLMLDEYNDVFSDFDPRPYAQRALSSDFIAEVKRASRDKASGVIDLKFLIPAHLRIAPQEAIIKRRLKEHFKKHLIEFQNEVRSIVKQGAIFAIIGVVLMILTSYAYFTAPEKSFLMSFIITLFEPASWFLFWEGLRLVIFEPKEKKSDLEFYSKMSKCEITFTGY